MRCSGPARRALWPQSAVAKPGRREAEMYVPANLMRFIATAVSLFCGTMLCAAQSSAEKALHVLRTSLDRRERVEAFSALREASELPASATNEIGRLILSGGREADWCAEILPKFGERALPIMAKLMDDSSL